MTLASDATQADGEGAESGGSKPPNLSQSSTPNNHSLAPTTAKPSVSGQANTSPQIPPASPRPAPPSRAPSSTTKIPLPDPESGALPKEPGLTHADLHAKSSVREPSYSGRSVSEVSSESPTPTFSDAELSRPPSKSPSRANSSSGPRPPILSFLTGGHKSTDKTVKAKDFGSSGGAPTSVPNSPDPSRAPTPAKKAPSVRSEDGGHKFTLKDLLASGPKLTRRNSQKSASSRGSDSGKSAGDSTASLLKKYGVCEKVAIGKGATSVVRLAHKWDRSEEKLYAVKEFRKRRKNETEKEYVKKLTAEFCISSTLHHVNVVETVDLVQDEAQHWCEVMEFCPGGDLYAAIKKGGMSPSEVECCFKQMVSGVAYLHGQGVAHRDIKPENLLFDIQGRLKIGDFGASTVYRLPWEKQVHMSTGLCGSEPYIAPEQFLGKPYDARLVDVWACGIVYYCLHFQEIPWRVAQTSDQLYAAYATACSSSQADKAACPPTINNLSPRACRPLIRKMLEPDPKKRYSIEDIMKHSWVETLEVCHASAKPSHIHVNAASLAQSQVSGVGKS